METRSKLITHSAKTLMRNRSIPAREAASTGAAILPLHSSVEEMALEEVQH